MDPVDFLELAAVGDWPKLRGVLQAGLVDVNYQHQINGWTAMHWACKRGNRKVIQLLLEFHARIDIPDSQGRTASDVCTDADAIKYLQKQATSPSDSYTGAIPFVSPAKEEPSQTFVPNYIAHPEFLHSKKNQSLPIPQTTSYATTYNHDSKHGDAPTTENNTTTTPLDPEEGVRRRKRLRVKVPKTNPAYFRESQLDVSCFNTFRADVRKLLKLDDEVEIEGFLKLPHRILISQDDDLPALSENDQIEVIAPRKKFMGIPFPYELSVAGVAVLVVLSAVWLIRQRRN